MDAQSQRRRSVPGFLKRADVDPKKVPAGVGRSTYFGTIPQEVNAAVPLLHDLDEAVCTTLVQQLGMFLNQADGLSVDALAQLNSVFKPGFSSYLTEPTASVLVTGLYTIMKTCIQQKVRMKQIEDDLKRMNVPACVVTEVVAVVRTLRPGLESSALGRRLRCPQIAKFRWRIDITMSTGLLSKVMRPSIMVQMYLSSGIIKTFEISIEQFNQLRYGVAKVLQEMQRVERHPILRLINDDEKKDAEVRCK